MRHTVGQFRCGTVGQPRCGTLLGSLGAALLGSPGAALLGSPGAALCWAAQVRHTVGQHALGLCADCPGMILACLLGSMLLAFVHTTSA